MNDVSSKNRRLRTSDTAPSVQIGEERRWHQPSPSPRPSPPARGRNDVRSCAGLSCVFSTASGVRRLGFLCGLGLMLLPAIKSLAAVGFTISPATLTNDYQGKLTLSITGLVAGATVTIERYVDSNGNGILDPGEL